MGDKDEPIRNGAVAVKGNVIEAVGTAEEVEKEYSGSRVIAEMDSVMIPGLINTHTHAPMVYFRGMADDMPLKEWLEGHIWPAEEKWLGHEFVRDAAELACLEMVAAGVTTYNDMYFYGSSSAGSVHKVGMRAVLGAGVVDFPTTVAETTDGYIEKAVSFINEFRNDPLVVPSIAPHAPYTCGPDTYKKVIKVAEKYDVPIHTHLSETEWEVGEVQRLYGKRPVEHLESIGCLNGRMVAAHCIWVNEREMELLSRSEVGVSHCVESNLKLASGIAPVAELIRKGVRVTFGTDGAASNNDLDILSEMSTAAKLHKAVSGDPTVLDAKTALFMATRHGAEVLGLGNRLGRIKTGYLADIVVLDLTAPHLAPLYNVYSHIAYSAKSSDVKHVMINGRMVLQDRRALCCSQDEIIGRARRWAKKIRER